MRSYIILACLVSGCGDGGLGASGACKGLDESACRSRSDCGVGQCAGCTGGASFAGCYDPRSDIAPPCPGYTCPAFCARLGEAGCQTRSDCQADYCATCTARKEFTACRETGQPPTQCPNLPCPLPPACADVKDEALCKARTDCHPVFYDPGTCLCAQPGCCQMFQRCAEPDKADCRGPALCKRTAPQCDGDYVVSYDKATSCYEGCVRKSDCAP